MKWTNPVASMLEWTGDISNREKKERVAQQIAERVHDNDVIGVGSGSTSYLAIQAIAKKVHSERLNVIAIPTSLEVSLACTVLGIPTASLSQLRPDWCFDGADEVDSSNNLIKGRGGAMFKEKLVIRSSSEVYILVDESKQVARLGEKFAVPIEVYADAIHYVETVLADLGGVETKLRLAKSKDGPVITESGNLILDVRFSKIDLDLEKRIKQISGVVESGLFIGYDVKVVRA